MDDHTRGEGQVAVETEIGVMWPQPRNAGPQKLEEAKNGSSPRLQGEHGPPTPSFQPSDTGIEAVRE